MHVKKHELEVSGPMTSIKQIIMTLERYLWQSAQIFHELIQVVYYLYFLPVNNNNDL